MGSKIKLVVWSDFSCPSCFLSYLKIEKAISQLQEESCDFLEKIEIVHGPFELNQNHPPEGVDKYEYLSKKLGEETLKKVFAGLVKKCQDLEFNEVPKLGGVIGPSLDAHRVLLLAQEQNKMKEFKSILFKLYFTENLNLGDKNVLIERAEAIGINGVKDMLNSDCYIKEIQDARLVKEHLGFKTVPNYSFKNKIGEQSSVKSFLTDAIANSNEESSKAIADIDINNSFEISVEQWKTVLTFIVNNYQQ